MLWIILGVVALLVVALVLFYNRLVRLRNRVENAWAQVDVQLKRRYDLIPNLVETVKGYASHERETFEAVTNARAAAQSATGPAEQGAAEGLLSAALGRLIAVAEAYPELQADENFRQLQEELAQTENRIAVSRQVYNDTVLTYNTAIQTVPGVFFAGPLGFSKRDFFEVEGEPGRHHASRSSGRCPRGARARRGRSRQVVRPARGGRDGPGRPRRQPARRRGDPLSVRRLLQRRVPRGSAPRGRVARPGRGLGGRGRVSPRSLRGARVASASRAHSARRGRTRACESYGTTERTRSRGASGSTTACAGWRRPTTTSST